MLLDRRQILVKRLHFQHLSLAVARPLVDLRLQQLPRHLTRVEFAVSTPRTTCAVKALLQRDFVNDGDQIVEVLPPTGALALEQEHLAQH